MTNKFVKARTQAKLQEARLAGCANTMQAMNDDTGRPVWARSKTLALAAVTLALLGGCGSATKTVSVASSPLPAQSTDTTTQPTTSTATTTAPTGTTSSGTSSGGTPASTTRTGTAPAFAEKGAGSTTAEGLSAALAVLRAHGYTAGETSDYHPDQTLRVLIGTGAHSNDGYDKQAFFFVDGHYIGTDSSRPSAQLSVVSQSDTEVTLAYAMYRSSDPLCCPGGGQARVRFQLNNGHLTPLDPIPPVSSSTGLSRQ